MSIVDKIFQQSNQGSFQSFSRATAGKQIAIYGAGAGYHSFRQFVLSRYNLNPEIFIDERLVDGLGGSLYTLKSFIEKYPPSKNKDIYILVTVGNRLLFNEIKENLNRLGFNDVTSILDVYEYNLCYASNEMAENLNQILMKDNEAINFAFNKLSDEESRSIFLRILSGHLNKTPILSPKYTSNDQYIVEGLGLSEDNISLLDCGAYDGDTLIQFSERYGRISLAVALECDQKNFGKLISKNYPNIDKLIALPLGSADKTGQLFFKDDNKMQSRLTSELGGGTLVGVINCDEILRGLNFSKIVIDTEGYEIQSLNGMKKIIRDQAPDITVAAYHYPIDFYFILNLIDSIYPNYHFYLRNHSPFVAETVLYAVKK